MTNKLYGRFQRQKPAEILHERVNRDRYINAYFAFLFIEIATSFVFPCFDLYNYMNSVKRTHIALRAYMHASLGYAFISCVIFGAIVIFMAVTRLHAIVKNSALKGRKLYKIGVYCTVALVALLFCALLIV